MNPLYKFINGKRVVVLEKRQCDFCGNFYQPLNSKRKYCGKKCYYFMKAKRKDRVKWTDEMKRALSEKYMGSGNPMYGKEPWDKGKKRPEMSGDKHPNYKGGWIQDGYHCISISGRQIGFHTHLIEKKIGRKLTSQEVVHHVNGDKLDNRIENLQLMSRSDHMKLHLHS